VSILNDSQLFDFARAWAGIMLASAFGIGLYALVAAVERATTSWHPSTRSFSSE
jgi:ABC-type nitrate/sulfonate/bicarbonate transport system permease component